MAVVELSVDEEQEPTATRAHEKNYDPQTEDRTESHPLDVSRVRRLDVDAVLARSLAKVASE
jgi:hypothetical protein